MHSDKTTSQNLSRCSRNITIDMSQKQEINRFSEESQKLLVDMNSTEIFELCENAANIQCPDCNSFSESGVVYCSCGRGLKYKRSPTTNQKANNDNTSIPGFVVKKDSSQGPKPGQSERQIMCFRAKQMLKKARQAEHGGHPTILARWYAEESYEVRWQSTILARKKLYFTIARS